MQNLMSSLSIVGSFSRKKVLQKLVGASSARRVHEGFLVHMSSALYLSPLYSNNIMRGVLAQY